MPEIETSVRYRSIKVHEVTYVLPKQILESKACPICGGEMKKFEGRYTYSECRGCRYKQQSFNIKTNTVPTLGDIIGLGITFLVFLGLTAAGIKIINDIFGGSIHMDSK